VLHGLRNAGRGPEVVKPRVHEDPVDCVHQQANLHRSAAMIGNYATEAGWVKLLTAPAQTADAFVVFFAWSNDGRLKWPPESDGTSLYCDRPDCQSGPNRFANAQNISAAAQVRLKTSAARKGPFDLLTEVAS
jgi:hypothetical protein